MINDDTIKLLKECNAGIKMGVSSIDDVYDKVKSKTLKSLLCQCKIKHEELEKETHELLSKYHDSGKEPNPIAKGMAHIKTNIKLMSDTSDQTIAALLTDGCDMGVKSLSRYLNQYAAAEEKAKDIAKKLINLEEDLCRDIRDFL